MDARAQIVIGLGFGDEGKGTTVDWLARQRPSTVVRFNGGAQAAHHVVLPDGRFQRFAQFGSGTFVGAPTHLSRFMLVNPIAALWEARVLEQVGVHDPLGLLTIHEDALVTTPLHIAGNRLRELARGDGRHGSCGMGIGETVVDNSLDPYTAIRAKDLGNTFVLQMALKRHRAMKIEQVRKLSLPEGVGHEDLEILEDSGIEYAIMEKFLQFSRRVRVVDDAWLKTTIERGNTIFEGAQGVLLDETYGFHPHTTWSTTTFANADELLEGMNVQIQRLGVIRGFHTRHGAGPFVTEHAVGLRGDHNDAGQWQGNFRVGHFDAVALDYARSVAGAMDGIVMTWIDKLDERVTVCVGYEVDGRIIRSIPTHDLSEERTAMLSRARPVYRSYDRRDLMRSLPLVLTSHGPTHADKRVQGGLLR